MSNGQEAFFTVAILNTKKYHSSDRMTNCVFVLGRVKKNLEIFNFEMKIKFFGKSKPVREQKYSEYEGPIKRLIQSFLTNSVFSNQFWMRIGNSYLDSIGSKKNSISAKHV